MRFVSAKGVQCVVGVVLLGAAGIWGADVWAADPGSASKGAYAAYLTRANWDLLMRWVNFIILVVLILKYARRPVIEFLKGEKAQTARTIQQVEAQKRLAEEKIREGRIQLQASEARLTLIQERIVAEGKKRREQIIADAQQESRMMLAAARMRIDSQIRDAHDTIRGELIDMAFDKAMTKLPRVVTEVDQQQLIRLWVNEAQRSHGPIFSKP